MRVVNSTCVRNTREQISMTSIFSSNRDATILAYADIFLFSAVGGILLKQIIHAAREARRKGSSGVSMTGGEMRMVFMTALCVSNISRAISLIVDTVVRQYVREAKIQKSLQTWVNDVLMSFPSLFFLTSYSIVILFWAQVYYAAIMVAFPLLRPIFIFVNIAVYGVFLVISIVTLQFSSPKG